MQKKCPQYTERRESQTFYSSKNHLCPMDLDIFSGQPLNGIESIINSNSDTKIIHAQDFKYYTCFLKILIVFP